VAKHVDADEDGVRIAQLDEMSYRQLLWDHRPLTDFWRVGRGYQKKLEKNGAVFLPASGWRWQDGVYGTETKVSQLQEFGRYWSASYTTPEDACLLDFDSVGLWITDTFNVYGFSVRLVKDL
jgi:hypothetical protein